MSTPRLFKDALGHIHVERFTPIRRVEHIAVIVLFVALLVTGLPQKFDGNVSARVLSLLGGLDSARNIHRVVGFLFAGHAVIHIGGMVVGAVTGRLQLSLLPVPQDIRDAWHMLAYYFGFRADPPRLPKFDYRQKFEYIGLILGGAVMIASGLVLFFPQVVAAWLPGQVIPAARLAHSNEAMLAMLVLIVWHVYGSHLSPEIFPMDKSIFNGMIPLHEIEERHAAWYDQLASQVDLEEVKRQPTPGPVRSAVERPVDVKG